MGYEQLKRRAALRRG